MTKRPSLCRSQPWLFAFVSFAILNLSMAPVSAADQVDYGKDIKPLLSTRCVACHGALKQEGGLRLDTAALAIRGGDSGAAIKRGDAAASLLIERVTSTDETRRMPQEGAPLKAEQIELLRRWINHNAPAPTDEQPEADPRDHWAFQPVVRPTPPQLKRADWARNPIDLFVGREHERLGLTPQVEAPRSLLVRRLFLDLVGVPPTAEELAKIDADRADGWYERLVKQLLNDPRYGERWGRHWMDIWRYSDWWGLGDQLRNSQLHIWHWRDWLIESLNADLPYDEMIRQMLAADEIYPDDLSRLRATGYLARNYFLFNRNQWMDETVEHVSKSFLGLTLNCAKCHEHKYDPFPQTDFYRFRAVFEPYHVRLDLAPGEADFARNAIPRAFDGRPETPTYRYIRGQESQPDKSTVIAPGVPELLAFKQLQVEPVTLPITAWQPERRPWVLEAHREAAKQAVSKAESARADADKKLAEARRQAAAWEAKPAETPTTVEAGAKPESVAGAIVDDFQRLDSKRWQLFGGEWSHAAGKLEQKKDGATRAGFRLATPAPRDFDVTLRFTILGGSMWRSVSIGFDVTQADPAAESGKDDSEQTVYLSAVSGGSKLQGAYQQAGSWKYPAEATHLRPVELKRPYTLRVQVRDTLVNASVDGQPILTWRTPLARRAGALQFTTFDALAVFHEVSIAPLAADIKLREPGGAPSASPATRESAQAAVADAEVSARIAALGVEVARAELESVAKRADALEAEPTGSANGASEVPSNRQAELTAAAVKAERHAALVKAKHAAAATELRVLRAAADKKEAAEKELKAARDAVQKAEQVTQAAVGPNDHFTPLVGAKWTPTRFMNSGADDPQAKFGPQSTGRRRALADWLTDRRNPLTARVAVNHLWLRHWGTPLVGTVFDFGRKGSPPTHPDLLNWLAAEFMEHGWSMKHLHELMVTSATYRLSSSSAERATNVMRDPENRQWWRRTPLRLESQAIRDSILALAGTLDATRGGPPVPPAAQAESTRRSLYFFHSNNDRNLFLTTFDEATVKECYRREQSIVPQQALALTNSRLVLESASKIAANITRELGDDSSAAGDEAFARRAFERMLGIAPNDAELAACRKAFAAWRQLPDESRQDARTQFVWVLLNHNDFVTIR